MRKTAIVTGGSRGIGLGITKQLIEDGYAVVITAQSGAERHRDTLATLSGMGADCLYVQADISNSADRARCIAETLAAYGRIDALVNNAGVAPNERVDLLDMTEESFDRLIAVNTKGTLFMAQAAAKHMVAQEPLDGRRGVIVNVSSISATVSSTSRGEYCISKAGVSMVTTLFADRLASEGIGVYEVRPGIIATDMTAAVKEKYDALFAAGLCPVARWGTPEDVANAVSLLCSGRLSYSTGDIINVDGGFHIKRL
ncbi:MAG: 3-ketoacyl-ACP reductase [Oscillospiraceae bacterium]|jgi:NAD(P)-dependent dehydrogenase (short-subunit alcohol dehydrogenase family)|nr:3-ketoacyl-ACP reductase [Oscillospiraceae bacterium]